MGTAGCWAGKSPEPKGDVFGFAFPNDDTCRGVEDVRRWAVGSAGIPGGEGEGQTW